MDWDSRRFETVLVNKPPGFVSGDPVLTEKRGKYSKKIQFSDTNRVGRGYQSVHTLINEGTYYGGKWSEGVDDHLVKMVTGFKNGKGLSADFEAVAAADCFNCGGGAPCVELADGADARVWLDKQLHRKQQARGSQPAKEATGGRRRLLVVCFRERPAFQHQRAPRVRSQGAIRVLVWRDDGHPCVGRTRRHGRAAADEACGARVCRPHFDDPLHWLGSAGDRLGAVAVTR